MAGIGMVSIFLQHPWTQAKLKGGREIIAFSVV